MSNNAWNRAHLLALGALLVPIVGLGCVAPTHRSAAPLTPEEREVLTRSSERIEREREVRGEATPIASARESAPPAAKNDDAVASSSPGPTGADRSTRNGGNSKRTTGGEGQNRTAAGTRNQRQARPPGKAPKQPAQPVTTTFGSLQGQVRGISGEEDAPLVLLAIPIGRASHHSKGTTVLSRGAEGFDPPFLVVPIGETVRFENDDEICHSFFSSSQNHEFELGLLDPLTSGTYRVEQPGTVQIYCSLHSGKQASVFAVPTPHFGVVAEDGTYDLGRLEAGAYRVMLWSDGKVLRRYEVEVVPGAVTRWIVEPEPALLLSEPR